MNYQTVIETITKRLENYHPRELSVNLPAASVLIPLHLKANQLNLILTLRSQQLSTHRGQVAFPGGKRDINDADLVATALRETHEEIGLEPKRVTILGQSDQVISRYGYKVTPFVGLITGTIQLTADPVEIETIFHVPLDFFLQQKNVSTDTLEYLNETWHVPRYTYGKFEIWGLTAWIIANFLNTTLDANIPLEVPP